MSIESFYRSDLNQIPFWPNRPSFIDNPLCAEGFLKCDMGESILPVPKEIQKKLLSLPLNFYPGISENLLGLIAERDKIKKEQLFLANGSLALIHLLIRLFINPGKKEEVIICTPTYPLYESYIQLERAKCIAVPRIEYQAVDFVQLKRSITPKTKLIFIDNPSNPFGDITPRKKIEEVLSWGLPTVIDEAYFEFCNKTAMPLLKRFPNLIVLRTFSKAFSLAGLRIGYAAASQEIIHQLIRIKNPEEVNSVAQFLAAEMLKVGNQEQIDDIIAGRNYLLEKLVAHPFFQVYPSAGGYVMCRMKEQSAVTARQIYDVLFKQKIIIKVMDFTGLKNNFIRFNAVPLKTAKRIVAILSHAFIR